MRIHPSLWYLSNNIPSKFFSIKFIDIHVEVEFSHFGLIDASDTKNSPAFNKNERTFQYIMWEILIILAEDSLLFEVGCVDGNLEELIHRREDVKLFLALVP
jgi:hypothetical protein